MRAVILAGGQGTRLRPLTCDCPKPLVDFLGEPVLGWGLKHLSQHGFTQVTATINYRPDDIKDRMLDGSAYGVHLDYALEENPLGTAGGVRAVAKNDGTLLVYPGDAICDMDLSAALAFHRQKQAVVTLVLSRVPQPRSFGVVVCEEDGKIKRFVEKPDAGEMLSDAVNTGIYFLEQEAIDRIPKDTIFDFSKDLFPILLKEGLPMYGFEAGGYWCDVGDVTQYLSAHQDVLKGETNLIPKGKKVAQGYVGEGVYIAADSQIHGPVWLADGVVVESDAKIGPYAVIGSQSKIGKNAVIQNSVLWSGVEVGSQASIADSVLCKGCKIHKGVKMMGENAMGQDAVAEENAQLDFGVRVWPMKKILPNLICNENVVHQDAKKPAFGDWGIPMMLPPDGVHLAMQWGLSHGGEGKIYAVCGDLTSPMTQALMSGYAAGGSQVIPMPMSPLGALRHAIRGMGLSGGAWLYQDRLVLLGSDGIELSADKERSLEEICIRRDKPPVPCGNILPKIDVWPWYKGALCAGFEYKGLPVRLWGDGLLTRAAADAFASCGIPCVQGRMMPQELQMQGFAAGFALEDEACFVDDQGNTYDQGKLEGLRVLLALERGIKNIFVPPGFTMMAEHLAKPYQASVVRCRPGQSVWLNKSLQEEGGTGVPGVMDDLLQAVFVLLKWTQQHEQPFSALHEKLPQIYRVIRQVPCAPQVLAGAIGRFIGQVHLSSQEAGIGYADDQIRISLIGSREKPVIKVLAEASQTEMANEIAEDWQNKLIQSIEENK